MTSHSQRAPRRPHAVRTAEMRARLLDAAVAVLARDGYARASTWAVCAQAGASRGALLHHFPTRLELFSAAVDRMSLSVLAELETALRDCPAEAMLDRFLEWLWRTLDGDLFAVGLELVAAARTEPALRDRLRFGGDALAAKLEEAVTRVASLATREHRLKLRAALRMSVHIVRGIGLDLTIGGDRAMHRSQFEEWRHVLSSSLGGER